ncbi:DNA-binding transcriptional regulator, CsgD family [Streptomyces sp. TLI_053]|uniref:helix-turn-helix domain-containing protein n=1 Tax=Streptomyces sp. TLI_053 TaxID=1855352 RepID=UPI00087C8072|nr:helix-turn-helix domain-containing protein [Streptomyces sp. TLI_053]SDT83067.1 DNA-binding transcriptional regulator, CsgD family [Streptomyces sp. TLI_053]
MEDEDLPAHLCRLGLTRREAELYEALLASGPGGRRGEAEATGAEETGVEGTGPEELGPELARLRRLGLVTVATTDRRRHVPVEPTVALEYLAHSRAAEVRAAQQAAVNAYRGWRRSAGTQRTDDLVEVVTGDSIVEAIETIEAAAEREVLRFDSPPYHTHGAANPIEIENLRRGVEYRVVYARSAVQHAAYYAVNIQPSIAAGEQARILPTVPVKLTVFDRRLAIVSMSFVEAEANDSLLLVHPSSLLSALTGLFETSWRAALPMHLGDRVPPALSTVQRRIVELLATGVTDETIAELLGISRRTLSRQLEQLNSRAGSVTRFQMALHAARNGWI